MEPMILVINPGSTSTKTAVFSGERNLLTRTVDHSAADLECFAHIADQYKMRLAHVLSALGESGVKESDLSAVIGRGGLLPPQAGGAYRVNDAMVERLRLRPVVEHASNLGAILAYEIAHPMGIPAYIYDPITTDELDELARISGIPQLRRVSTVHALNSRAVALKTAQTMGKAYRDCRFIVAHMGGGMSFSAHRDGRMVDLVLDDEGAFSPERSGGLPAYDLAELCYCGKYNREEMKKFIRGGGGLKAYLGTVDAREVEARIVAGDGEAELCFRAMAYQIAKSIAQLSVVFCGAVDAIILTGGLAHSERLMGWVRERVSFLAPVVLYPGEAEMEAMAGGVLRVLREEETAKEYVDPS